MTQPDWVLSSDLAERLSGALAVTRSALCLCDPQDDIRYVNRAFRSAFFPDLAGRMNFVDAMAAAIASGKGIRLESMSLDTFVTGVKARRRHGPACRDFAVDLFDGTWWWVSDHRLDDGWFLVVAQDITSLKTEEARLRAAHEAALRASETDFLTGLPNRRSGMARAAAALEAMRAEMRPLTIALLDIDRFKAINDGYGHEVGDEVLVRFAQALRRVLRAGDHVSRMGGEEFMLVLPNTEPAFAMRRLDELMRTLAPVMRGIGEPALVYSFSAGLAARDPGDDVRSLLGRADAALYAAKASGRGRVMMDERLSSAA